MRLLLLVCAALGLWRAATCQAYAPALHACLTDHLYTVEGTREHAIYSAMRSSSAAHCQNAASGIACLRYYAHATGTTESTLMCTLACTGYFDALCPDVLQFSSGCTPVAPSVCEAQRAAFMAAAFARA